MSAVALLREAVKVKQELDWRIECEEDLVAFARTMPIPGVPQDDNYEQLIEQGELDWTWDTDEYDNKLHINQINTGLAEHHILMLETAQKIIEGTLKTPEGKVCKRGMFFFPPGSAKSSYLSVVVPAWVMGRHKDTPIILTGYADGICKKHGKRARQLCMSPQFQAVFDTTLDPDTKAADNWGLLNGSQYLSAGLQSGLTGNRAAGLIIDDPIKGRKAAESLAEQTATWDAYRDDARSRKVPTAFEILIQTRWHEKDLAGKLLPADWRGESGFMEGQDGNPWYVLCVPAIAEHEDDPLGREPGEPLWAEWFRDDGDPMEYWRS